MGLKSSVLASAAVFALINVALAQTPSLDDVLSRMREYVARYESLLSAVVAEEHYEQWITMPKRAGGVTATGRGQMIGGDGRPIGPMRRKLTADFLMLRLPGDAEWLGFREVLSVDGQPVRQREERLLNLFTTGSAVAVEQARAMTIESARFNIGDVIRTINAPTHALDFLHARASAHFSFRRTGEDIRNGRRVWRIAFQELAAPYLIRTPSGQGLRSNGLVWVDPQEGTVVQTQLNLILSEARSLLRMQIVANYEKDEALAFLVPVEMRESYERSDFSSRLGFSTRLEGRAEYRSFRQFQTTVRIVGSSQ